MASVPMSDIAGTRVAEKLGLSTDNLREFKIVFRAGELVTIEAQYYAQDEGLAEVEEMIEEGIINTKDPKSIPDGPELNY